MDSGLKRLLMRLVVVTTHPTVLKLIVPIVRTSQLAPDSAISDITLLDHRRRSVHAHL